MNDTANEHQVAISHKDVVEHLWTAPVFEAACEKFDIPPASSLLVAESRCGYVPLRLVDTLPEDTRIIALDPSRAMLDQARQRIDEQTQRRVFFVPQHVNSLSYADDVFRGAICLNGVLTMRQAAEALGELSRVTSAGGSVLLGAPMGASFEAVFDMLDEALRAHQLNDVLGRLYELPGSFLTPGRLAELAESSGLHDVEVEEVAWEVVFESGQDLFLSPLVRETFFPHWVGVVRSSDREPILRYVSDAIDTYWHDREFRCKIVACAVSGMR